MDKLADKRIDAFDAGDTIRVNVNIVEGANRRVQAFEGLCIAKKDRGLHTSFVVRKISNGEVLCVNQAQASPPCANP